MWRVESVKKQGVVITFVLRFLANLAFFMARGCQ